MIKSRILKPHEAADHIAALLRGKPICPYDPMKAIRYALVEALAVLKVEGASNVSTRNKWQCDDDDVEPAATAYYAWKQKTAEAAFQEAVTPHPQNMQAADKLASFCLQIIKRGHVTDRDREVIPLLLKDIVGYVPDMQSAKGHKPRPKRTPDLLGEIVRSLKSIGREANWKNIAAWLASKDECTVIEWDDKQVKYRNDNELEEVITAASFRNLIARARKQLPK